MFALGEICCAREHLKRRLVTLKCWRAASAPSAGVRAASAPSSAPSAAMSQLPRALGALSPIAPPFHSARGLCALLGSPYSSINLRCWPPTQCFSPPGGLRFSLDLANAVGVFRPKRMAVFGVRFRAAFAVR